MPQPVFGILKGSLVLADRHFFLFNFLSQRRGLPLLPADAFLQIGGLPSQGLQILAQGFSPRFLTSQLLVILADAGFDLAQAALAGIDFSGIDPLRPPPQPQPAEHQSARNFCNRPSH